MTASAGSLPSLVAGDVVGGKYVLDRELGRGGMGAVYAARQTNFNNRPVAIKVMLAEQANEEARQRFLNEGSAAAMLRSEHVVQVYDLGSERGFEYMVLELLDGQDLSQLLERQGPLAPAVTVGYALQALRGLVEAHRNGIVHRDLKPSNLFLTRRPDGSTVLKILDFGISKSQGIQSQLGQPAGQLTSTKAMLGSPLYMSPEQLRSSKSVDARADIWAMGVILYELMTGQLPYMGESLGELFAAILENEAKPPRTHNPAIPPALEEIVMRCLRKRPEERFQSSQELLEALDAFSRGGAVTSLLSGGSSPSSPGIPVAAPPPGMIQTPANPSRPELPPMASTTGSGANIPVVKATVPLGAVTPGVGLSQSGSQWTPPPAPPTTKNPALFAVGGVFALLALAGVGFGAKSVLHGKTAASASAPVASELPPVASVASAAPPSPPPTAASSAPAASSVAAAPEPPVTPVTAPAGGGRKPTPIAKPGGSPKPEPVAVTPTPPPPTPPAPQPPPAQPTPKPTSTVQLVR